MRSRKPSFPSLLDEARAGTVLEHICADGTFLDRPWFDGFRNRGISEAAVDRALRLLAERGQIRLLGRWGCVEAKRAEPQEHHRKKKGEAA